MQSRIFRSSWFFLGLLTFLGMSMLAAQPVWARADLQVDSVLVSENFDGNTTDLISAGWYAETNGNNPTAGCPTTHLGIVDAAPDGWGGVACGTHTGAVAGDRAFGFYKSQAANISSIQYTLVNTFGAVSNISGSFDFESTWQRFCATPTNCSSPRNRTAGFQASGGPDFGYTLNQGGEIALIDPLPVLSNSAVSQAEATLWLSDAQMESLNLSSRGHTFSLSGVTLAVCDTLTFNWHAESANASSERNMQTNIDNFILNADIVPLERSTLYVDDDWAGLPLCTEVTVGSHTHRIGIDAFGSIQGAVSLADAGAAINVANGSYNEDVFVTQPLNFYGSQSFSDVHVYLAAAITVSGMDVAQVTVQPGGSIQDAIALASVGGAVEIEAGIYTENITVNKWVTLTGAGSGSDAASNTIWRKLSNHPLIVVAASGNSVSEPILLQDFRLEPVNMIGISIPNTSGTVSNLSLDNVFVIGTNESNDTENERGLYVGPTATLSGLTIRDSAFDHLTYGWYLHKQVSTDTSTVMNVSVTDTSFTDNDAKGIYAEKLNEATFSRVTVQNNGLNTAFFNARWNGGFDFNLKTGTYQNITIDQSVFRDNGLNIPLINEMGAALMIKARDDGSYAAYPATLSNVTVSNCSFAGNQRAIRIGEPARSNTTPTDVVVKGNVFDSDWMVFELNVNGQNMITYANNLTNFTAAGLTGATGTFNARHNWWGTYSVQPTGLDNDSWAYRLGAPVGTWVDGSTSVALADSIAGTDAAFSGAGTLVIINHGHGMANVPFGKGIPEDTGAFQCADFYDFFAIGGSGSYNLSIPVDSTCTDILIDANLYQFALDGSGAPDLTCSPDTACWNQISATRNGDVLTAVVDAGEVSGTPFAAPSRNNNDPTAVQLIQMEAGSTRSPGWVVGAVVISAGGISLAILRRRKT